MLSEKKRVVLLSGGIDSSAELVDALLQNGVSGDDIISRKVQDIPYKGVFPLFVNYDQRAVDKEWLAANRLCLELGLVLRTVSLQGFSRLMMGASAILNSEVDTTKAGSYVPGRNNILLALGLSLAEAKGAKYVHIGLIGPHLPAGQRSPENYPDTTLDFIEAVNNVSAIGTVLAPQVIQNIPRKTTAIKLLRMMKLYSPELHWSCHVGGSIPCEECKGCKSVINAEAKIERQRAKVSS